MSFSCTPFPWLSEADLVDGADVVAFRTVEINEESLRGLLGAAASSNKIDGLTRVRLVLGANRLPLDPFLSAFPDAYQSLTHLRLDGTIWKDRHGLDVFDETIPPLYHLTALKSLDVRTKGPVGLDTSVVGMGRAWPLLESLKIVCDDGGHGETCLERLVTFTNPEIYRCLNTLYHPFNWDTEIEKLDGPFPVDSALRSLDIGEPKTPLIPQRAEEVSIFLATVCPIGLLLDDEQCGKPHGSGVVWKVVSGLLQGREIESQRLTVWPVEDV